MSNKRGRFVDDGEDGGEDWEGDSDSVERDGFALAELEKRECQESDGEELNGDENGPEEEEDECDYCYCGGESSQEAYGEDENEYHYGAEEGMEPEDDEDDYLYDEAPSSSSREEVAKVKLEHVAARAPLCVDDPQEVQEDEFDVSLDMFLQWMEEDADEVNTWDLPGADNAIMAIARALGDNHCVRKLILPESDVGEAEALEFARALHQNTTLRLLDLLNCSIGDQGGLAIARALESSNTTLRTLSLIQAEIGSETVRVLARVLESSHCALRTLEIPGSNYMEQDAVALARALEKNSTLTHLAMNKGAAAVARMLGRNASLARLEFCDDLDDESALILADSLAVNSSLVVLQLREQIAGAQGLKAILGALLRNTALTSVHLCGNNDNDGGAVTHALARVLETNTTLAELECSSCALGPEGAWVVARALERNTSLTYLNVSANNMGSQGALAFVWLAERNHTLSHLSLLNDKLSQEARQALIARTQSNPRLVDLDMNGRRHRDSSNLGKREAFFKALLADDIDSAQQMWETGVAVQCHWDRPLLRQLFDRWCFRSIEWALNTPFGRALLFECAEVDEFLETLTEQPERHEGLLARMGELVRGNAFFTALLARGLCKWSTLALCGVLRKRLTVDYAYRGRIPREHGQHAIAHAVANSIRPAMGRRLCQQCANRKKK